MFESSLGNMVFLQECALAILDIIREKVTLSFLYRHDRENFKFQIKEETKKQDRSFYAYPLKHLSYSASWEVTATPNAVADATYKIIKTEF